MFTQSEIKDLISIIELQHILFIYANVGIDFLFEDEINILKSFGIEFENIENTPFDEMFKWGILSIALGNYKSQKVDYKQFEDFLKSNKYNVDLLALNIAKRQASSDIRGLGNKISQFTQQTLIEHDRQQRLEYEKIIADSAVENIKSRKSISSLISTLGKKTNDWTRDFGRISDYVMTQAYEEGRASYLASQYGNDAFVYKKVFQTACKKCVKLFLTNGIGSKPKVFKISELKSNGTNIGRKVEDWLPVIGPVHPFCRCMLVYVDSNYEWNEKTQDFDSHKEFKRKVERKSKVKIKVGDKTFEV